MVATAPTGPPNSYSNESPPWFAAALAAQPSFFFDFFFGLFFGLFSFFSLELLLLGLLLFFSDLRPRERDLADLGFFLGDGDLWRSPRSSARILAISAKLASSSRCRFKVSGGRRERELAL